MCQLVSSISGIGETDCIVSDSTCASCLSEGEATITDPTPTVRKKLFQLIEQHDPDRLAAMKDYWGTVNEKPSDDIAEKDRLSVLSKTDLPCTYRSQSPHSIVRCKPCRGGNYGVFHCEKFEQDCIIHAARSSCSHICALCDDRTQSRPFVTPSNREILPGVWSKSHPRQTGVLYNWADESSDHWSGVFRGQSVFLCGGGPSLNDMDLTVLDRRGVMIAAMNQIAATHVRPHIWFSVDNPQKFHPRILRDQMIMKFTRRDHRKSGVRNEKVALSDAQMRSMSNIWFYRVKFGNGEGNTLDPSTFFTFPRPTWGGRWGKNSRSETKSVMLVALWMLYWMGFRTVFLVGCDFRMRPGAEYAFESEVGTGYIAGNNTTYNRLREWFEKIPFAESGMRVYQCTPNSKLTVFPYISLEDAADYAGSLVPHPEKVATLY